MATWSFRTIAVLILLVGAACAGNGEPANSSRTISDAEVIGDGYRHIAKRYIRRVSMRKIAGDGLGGLSTIDPAIKVKFVGRIAYIQLNGTTVARVATPRSNDYGRWAGFTVSVIEKAGRVSSKIKEAGPERIYEVVFDSTLAGLDRYSRYASAEEARDHRAVRDGYGGIGVRIQLVKGVTKVISVTPGAPADTAGVKTNDSIVKIEGEPITGAKMRDVVRRLRGPRGTNVNITLARASAPRPIEVTLERRHIVPVTVTYKRDRDIAYVRVSRFNLRTGRQVASAVAQAEREIGPLWKGIILDLRDNPGGLLDQAITVSDVFLPSGRIVSTRGRHPDSHQFYDALKSDLTAGRRLVVLINGRSASSSEIVASAIQDSGRGVIVGSNSFGKGTVQSVFNLPNEGELILTWSRFHAPSGYTLQDLGVLPTLCTSRRGATPKRILARLRNGRSDTVAALRAWRATRPNNKTVRLRLRRACPRSVARPKTDVDLVVARRLLREPGLYRRALKLATPKVASYRKR